ncbi:MAG TPA: SMR family transporter [Puia sp.]|jgi:quaternary ammonium compound-resistance protein SugE|nr:SMR family transporter [Puia sp.]
MAWFYLFIGSVFEMAWTFSLRFMNVKKLKALHWKSLFTETGNWAILWPFVGYVVFGLANVYCVSLAMKDIPASTVLAVWMGTTLVGVKLVEILFLKSNYDLYQFLYIGLILVGIVGLKRNP